MRTARAATFAIVGLLALAVIVPLTATAGCSSIVAQPGACATAMYESAKKNAGKVAGEKAQGALLYAGQTPAAVSACGPGFLTIPAVEWSPQPAVDGNLAYLGDQQSAVVDFGETGPASVFPDSANLGNRLWGNTADVIVSWNENVFNPISAVALEFVAGPTAPDPEAFFASLGSAGDHAGASAGCIAARPLPSL